MPGLTQKRFLDLPGLSAFWTKAKKYVDDKSSSLTGTINGLTFNYVSKDKTIVLKNGDTNIGTVDCTDFIKDSFVQSGEVVTREGDGKQILRLTLITVERPGETGTTQTIDIDVDKLFSQKAVNITMADGKTVEKALSDVIAESGTNKTDIATLKNESAAHESSISSLNEEFTNLQNTDTRLNENINDLSSRITTLNNDYQDADTALGGRIDGVVTDYQAADTAVYNAITAISIEGINALFT